MRSDAASSIRRPASSGRVLVRADAALTDRGVEGVAALADLVAGRADAERVDPVDRVVDVEISCSAGVAADRTRLTRSRTTRSAARRSTARRTSFTPVRLRNRDRIRDRD